MGSRSVMAALAALSIFASAVAAQSPEVIQCATPGLPRAQADIAQQRLQVAKSRRWEGNTLIVPVAVHLILNGKTGDFSASAVQTLVDNMNWAFDGTGYQFELTRVDRTKNKQWHLNCLSSKNEPKMKKKLAYYPAQVLNIYTCYMPGIVPGTTTLGIATQPFGYFPQFRSYPENHYMQGIMISPKTMPVSSSYPDYWLGLTAAHEVGHWLGLFHTFHPGTFGLPSECSEPGDYVADTPVQDLPTGSCTQNDTCSGPGMDDFTNFMDYHPDQCGDHFTPGQISRMQAVTLEFRPSLVQ